MSDCFSIDGYDFQKEWLENQVQYHVSNRGGYVCRLVPGQNGFESSKLDRVVENTVSQELVKKLGDLIEAHEA